MQLIAILLGSLLAAPADDAKPKHPGYETKKDHDPDGTGKFYMDREIAHVMSFRGASWLERPERVKEEGEPEKLYKALDVKPGMVIADMGAGSGYHTFKLAPLVGPEGKVLAADVQPQMLEMIRAKAKKQKVDNVELVASTEKDPKLAPESVDLILMVDVYHEFAFPYEMMEKMVASLKPGGKIAFVEFRLEDPNVHIKLVHKMTERQVIREMTPFPEMKHEKTVGTLPWQHVVVFEKK